MDIISTEMLVLLAFAAGFAGFIDAMAGGGGLITMPALLLAQIPPVQALATNKLQSSFGSFSASIKMIRSQHANPYAMRTMLVTCFLGSVAGTLLLYLLPPNALEIIIPIVIAVICLYFLFAPALNDEPQKPKISNAAWTYICTPILGFYDGYLGPGAGMFYTMAQVYMRGKSVLQATAHAKLLNFASNIASLAVFIAGGKVVWVVGACMIFGQIVGGYLGASVAIKGGSKLIRMVIVCVCLVMLASYVWQKN